MKKYLAIMAVLALSLSLGFAAGSKEIAETNPQLAAAGEFKAVSLTGTVHQDVGRPLIFKSEGVEYYVRLPLANLGDVKVSQGESVSVEGFVFMPEQASGIVLDKPVLHVEKAVIQGTTYVFVAPGMMGGRMFQGQDDMPAGRMQGRGGMPGRGGMRGFGGFPGQAAPGADD